MKRLFSLIFMLIIFVFLILFPKQALAEAKTGLMLWFYTLLPSLLPFMILSGFLIKTDLITPLLNRQKRFWRLAFGLSPNGSYALCMGLFCGYPMGAKISADLFRTNRISRREACYLLTFSSYPGPSFLSSYLCVGLFKRPDLILPTYIIIYLSGFLCSLLFRFTTLSQAQAEILSSTKKEISASHDFGELLDISIMNAFESITKLGGYIILFSIVQGMIKLLPFRYLKYFLCGLTEITTGASLLFHSSLPFYTAYPLILALTSLGGLCIAAQTDSMLTGTDLPITAYLKGKLCCCICTYTLALLFVKIIKVIF